MRSTLFACGSDQLGCKISASFCDVAVTFSMPPYTLWFEGFEPVRQWLLGPGSGCRGSKLLPVAASGSPAFAQYRPTETAGRYQAWALIVLEIAGDRIAGWNSFLDTERLFPMFDLPLQMTA